MTTQQQWMPQIDRALCTGCGDCIDICPTQALSQVEGKATVIRPEACNYCAVCEDICPTGAIGLPYQITFSEDYRKPNNERH
jgi:formate hydrogenlyase subunit 6/NADH:ubiquinone oxidoreductase subunit I